jgi:hypothetical protein
MSLSTQNRMPIGRAMLDQYIYIYIYIYMIYGRVMPAYSYIYIYIYIVVLICRAALHGRAMT